MRRWLLGCCVLVGVGCGARRVRVLEDFHTSDQQVRNARKAASVGQRRSKLSQRAALRSHAWQVVGRLKLYDPRVAEAAIQTLGDPRNPSSVRARAAWAIGEIGRDLPWNEQSRGLSAALERAMRGPLSPEAAYYTVEAFGKVFPQHPHSHDESVAAAAALNALAAGQTRELPSVFYVVQGRVLTFDVIIELLANSVRQAEGQRSPQTLASAYASALTMVRWLDERQAQLLTTYDAQSQALDAAFDQLLGAMSLRQRSLTLMLALSLGNIADEPVFAEVVARRMAVYAQTDDPLVRAVMAWSLSRLRAAAGAREALRDDFLGTESDDRVFRILHHTRTDPAEMDLIQQLYDVAPR